MAEFCGKFQKVVEYFENNEMKFNNLQSNLARSNIRVSSVAKNAVLVTG